MSSHDYGILSAPAGHHDHYPSAFMQGYNNQSYYSGDRYPSPHQHSHLSSSQPQPLDRYLHVAGQHEYPRDAHLFERRIFDGPLASPQPHLRPSYILPPPREQAPVATFPPPPASFEYGHAPLAHSTLPPAHRRDSLSSIASSCSNLVDFDPRPPHAGWTPKEEIDDEETRELLVSSKGDGMNTRSPLGGGSYLDRMSSNTSPRDESVSPGGDSARGGGNNSGSPPDSSSRKYSFVSLPGNAVRKRPRRRYDEIERLYACSWPDCPKAYGTLNHLNAHVTMQGHGPKRSPMEFKELRKQWREQKKQDIAVMPPAAMDGQRHGMESEPNFYFRRRRATEPNLAVPGSFSDSNRMLDSDDSAAQINLQHRLSLQNVRHFTDDTETRHGGASLSPISATSEGVGYWQQQETPLSPQEERRHHHHHDMTSPDTLHYSVGSSPLISSASPGLSTSLSQANRLRPDGTLLTPYSGYNRPPPASPPSPLSRTAKGGGGNNTLLQHPMASLTSKSEGHRPSDIFEDRRP